MRLSRIIIPLLIAAFWGTASQAAPEPYLRLQLEVPIFFSETANTPTSCPSPFGGEIANGLTITAYESELVPFGQTCVSEERTCANGDLSGAFEFQNCSTYIPSEAEKEQWFKSGIFQIQSYIRAGGYSSRAQRVSHLVANPPEGFLSDGSHMYSPWGERLWFQSGGPTIDGVQRRSFRFNIDNLGSARCHMIVPVVNGASALGTRIVQIQRGGTGGITHTATTSNNFVTMTQSQANSFCNSPTIPLFVFMEF